MRRLCTIIVFAALSLSLSLSLSWGMATAADGPARATPCPLKGDFKTLPAGIDLESANRLWCWMKHEVDAPLDLPPPPVFVGPLRSDTYSVFMFPTPRAPGNVLSIEISTSMMRYEDPLFVLWALRHELAHALLRSARSGSRGGPSIRPLRRQCSIATRSSVA